MRRVWDNEPQFIAEKDNSWKDSRDNSITLHPVTGQPHLGGVPTPKVMFTIHIGTMIFSDVAVINYRDLKLVLTWKFYDQSLAMSHMRPGRVVHFDFSTEYDLKLSEDFLNYMKTEELTIFVCEVNKLDAPLAYCSLPLREALLHTNRRADMSLALVADPRMRLPPSSDDIDTRDEMGVLDLWCMLRADIHVLPLINKAIAQNSHSWTANHKNDKLGKPRLKSFSGPIMSQVNEDDQDDVRMSEELDSLSPVKRLPKRQHLSESIDRGNEQRSRQPDRMRFNDYQRRNTGAALSSLDISYPIYPPVTEQKSTVDKDDKRPSLITNATNATNDTLTSTRRSSAILINDVPPNIRNVADMKQALEKRLVPDTQNRKVSLKHDRMRIKGKQSSLDEILNKAFDRKAKTTTPAAHKDISSLSLNSRKTDNSGTNRHGSQAELIHKYETVSQILGARRTQESFKHVQMRDDPSDYLIQYNNKDMKSDHLRDQSIDITILWLALNEECQAMNDPNVQRLYVAYTFLGRGGAELETPMSLPKPKQYQDKCYFNFKTNFHLSDNEFLALGRLARGRSNGNIQSGTNSAGADCVAFTVVSEPEEDPLGLNNCEDIGVAYLYFGDLLAYSAGSDTYTDVLPVRALQPSDNIICGVLAVKVDGLAVVRQSAQQQGLTIW